MISKSFSIMILKLDPHNYPLDISVCVVEFQVVKNYKDFAFCEYARVGRALALYEVGDREEAIAEMEDVSVALKGYPGISKLDFPQFYAMLEKKL